MNRAYSYIRFSTPDQISGDSFRRQKALSDDYCKRNNLTLDESLNLRDLGVSAFRGSNAATGALAGFLDAVNRDRVPKGSTLIVENLDRLTRDEVGKALSLFISILDADIHIVTLKPEVEYTKKSINDISVILQAVLQLFLGHEESDKKSGRLREAWDEKRVNIGKKKLTGKAPFWLKLSEDKATFAVLPDKVKIVKRIYQLALAGRGSKDIARILNADKIPSPYNTRDKNTKAVVGRKPWNNVSVLWMLRNRGVMGELTPFAGPVGNRAAVADPIVDYYPRIISDADFYAAQAAIAGRLTQRGPRGKRVRNLFTGMLFDARDGCTMQISEKRKDDPRIVSSGAVNGNGASYVSFPLPVLEEAILTKLAEVKVNEVLGLAHDPDERESLRAQRTAVEARIAQLEAALNEGGDIPSVARVLRTEEDKRKKLIDLEAKATSRQSAPRSAAWEEAQPLAVAVRNSPNVEETRLRLRGILRRIIDKIMVLIVPTSDSNFAPRLCAVQVWFAETDKSKTYMIVFQPGRPAYRGGGRERIEPHAEVGILPKQFQSGDLDLRDRDQAARLASDLASWTPTV